MEQNENQIWVAIPKAELEALKSNQEEIKNLFLNNQKETFLNRWVESTEARKQLKVSERTWQRIRDEKVIPFSQFGRKIYVRQSDIEAFLNRNLVASVQ
ncbi:MAG: helix-turn-helix domain-containing protein [Bacteroidales bacterium]|nr:helix-turn-helix domain-containing protein [Bacteroidales bacterium]